MKKIFTSSSLVIFILGLLFTLLTYSISVYYNSSVKLEEFAQATNLKYDSITVVQQDLIELATVTNHILLNCENRSTKEFEIWIRISRKNQVPTEEWRNEALKKTSLIKMQIAEDSGELNHFSAFEDRTAGADLLPTHRDLLILEKQFIVSLEDYIISYSHDIEEKLYKTVENSHLALFEKIIEIRRRITSTLQSDITREKNLMYRSHLNDLSKLDSFSFERKLSLLGLILALIGIIVVFYLHYMNLNVRSKK